MRFVVAAGSYRSTGLTRRFTGAGGSW